MKRVPGFDYLPVYATEDGRIFSNGKEKKAFSGKRDPYLYVNVTIARGKYRNRKVHQLVCAAFYGLRPKDKHLTRHLDGNPKNNHFSNLRWGTYSENVFDTVAHGRHPFLNMSPEIRRRNGNAGALKAILRAKGTNLHSSGRWRAEIVIGQRKISLGYYDNEREAIAARLGAVKLYIKEIWPKRKPTPSAGDE